VEAAMKKRSHREVRKREGGRLCSREKEELLAEERDVGKA